MTKPMIPAKDIRAAAQALGGQVQLARIFELTDRQIRRWVDKGAPEEHRETLIEILRQHAAHCDMLADEIERV